MIQRTPQAGDVAAAGFNDPPSIHLGSDAEQQMFESEIFVSSLFDLMDGHTQRLL